MLSQKTSLMRSIGWHLFFVVLALLVSTSSRADPADNWPERPIRFVINYPAGGAVDAVGRAIATPLYQKLKQPVVVENRPGAGGTVGAHAVAKSEPDGYTFLVSSGAIRTTAPHVYSKMPLDPVNDLIPVAGVSKGIQYLLVRADLPVKDAKEFLDYLRKNSAQMTYGSAGVGTGPHLTAEMFQKITKTSALHVPYKGAAPAIQDLLAGRIDYLFDPGVNLGQLQTGKIRLLAVGGVNRSRLYPDIPTLDEVGVHGFDADALFGVFAPVDTPPAILAKLNRAITELLDDKELIRIVAANGAEVADAMTPEEFTARLDKESKRVEAITKERNIKAD